MILFRKAKVDVIPMAKAKSNPQIMLRPQDLVVLLRLSLEPGAAPSYAILAEELNLTASEIHAGLNRALAAQLVRKDEFGKVILVREALHLFLQYGARYAFPAVHGSISRGMPTGYAAAPLKRLCKQMNPCQCGPSKTVQFGALLFTHFILLFQKRRARIRRSTNYLSCSMLFEPAVTGSARWRSKCLMKDLSNELAKTR